MTSDEIQLPNGKILTAKKTPSETHKNHRTRLRERFIKNPSSLTKHELTELLLFYCIPRRNTNPIAHELMDAYGSLSSLVHADAGDLQRIDGIGERSAAFLSLIGKLCDIIRDEKYNETEFYSFDAIKEYLLNFYKDTKTEVFCAFFLAKNDKIIRRKTYSDGNEDKVSFLLADLAKETALSRPASVIIAHNHPSGNPSPSLNDDRSTEKIFVILSAAGVRLYDHIIVGNEYCYSYRNDGRLDEIENKYGF